MERLTKRLDDGQAVMDCKSCELNSLQNCTALACRNRLKERLTAYEDTGLTPEQVKDMAENAETRILTWFEAKYGFPVGKLMDFCEAEQQGRLVVLPCKVGTEVYKISPRLNGNHEIVKTWFSLTYIKPYDFGKTVFLTREEAEAALRGGKEDG